MLWLLAAFVAYVLVGYPLLLKLLARKARPVYKVFQPRSVSVLLAVRNGEQYMATKLDSLLALDYPRDHLEILVLSDGSTDGAEEIVRRYSDSDSRIRWIPGPALGKWNALNRGLAAAQGEILFFTDIRQPIEPNALRELISCFADERVGCVSGELEIAGGGAGLYWRYEKFIRKQQARIDSVIGATGAIYAQRRSLCRPLPPDTILDDVHFPLQAFFGGYRVVFEENAKAWDTPTELDREFQRKVRTLAGNYQLIAAFPALLTPRNRMLFHFLSHKFARLLLPFALLAFFAMSVERGLWWLAALQVVAYLLPGPPRTFTVLMAATFFAASYLWRGPKGFWK